MFTTARYVAGTRKTEGWVSMRAAMAAIAALVLAAGTKDARAQSDLIGAEAFDVGLDVRASVVGGERGWRRAA